MGQRVILQFDSVLRVGNAVVDNQKRVARSRGGARNTARIYRVEQVNGPWLWLKAEEEGASGWIRAAEVIRYDQAIDYFTNQIRASRRITAPIQSRSSSGATRENDLALADFNEAIRLDPGYAVAYDNRGIAWHAKSEYDKAIADYGEAIRLDPRYARLLQPRHRWHAKSDYDRRSPTTARRSGSIPGTPRLLQPRHRLVQVGYDKAIADYGEAIRLDPKYAAAYNNRGIAWSAKSEYDMAIADYGEAIRLDPGLALAVLQPRRHST